ncbi:MAG TPA: hypothetical protein VHA74_01620, partial [Candidatus Dojkabacteria bacterium]|nr:hypothetical protein [Candidatus Dojkabacteria bacterium]
METRTYKERSEYLKKKVIERRKKLKLMAIEYKGGSCYFCKYKKCHEALEFHHIERDNKDFGLSSRGLTRSWKRVQQELDKCVLVCANCH